MVDFLSVVDLLFSLAGICTGRVVLAGAVGRGLETRLGRDIVICPYLNCN